jgi:hypothetical protein
LLDHLEFNLYISICANLCWLYKSGLYFDEVAKSFLLLLGIEMSSYTFPGDPLSRAWIEVSGTNPLLVDEYRPALIAFLAFDRGFHARLVGTGFVIAGNSNLALVITARHVLANGVAQVQQRPMTPSSLNPRYLKASWMGTNSAGLLDILFVSFNNSTDIAACLVAPQGSDPQCC